MKVILQDQISYRNERQEMGSVKSNIFSKQARKILFNSESGKKLQHLLEEKYMTPSMRGQPKTHKEGVPMRLLLEFQSTMQTTQALAKPVTQSLGKINPTHLKNLAGLLEKLEPKMPLTRRW